MQDCSEAYRALDIKIPVTVVALEELSKENHDMSFHIFSQRVLELMMLMAALKIVFKLLM